MLNWASMCLDPGHFKDPLEFDFDRHITVNPAFGHGSSSPRRSTPGANEFATALRVWLTGSRNSHLSLAPSRGFTAGIVRETYDFYLEFPAGGK